MPSASTVAFAIRSEPGSKFESSWPSRPRPLSPERTPTTRPSSTSSLAPASRRGCRRPRPRPAEPASGRAARPRSRGCRGCGTAAASGLQRDRPLAVRQQVDRVLRRPARRSASPPRAGPGTASASPTGSSSPPTAGASPAPLPFSTSATGTSPSDSSSASSSASSCVSRIAQASPAGPPPTITTPTSIRSSSGSVGAPTNSLRGVDGRRELDRGGGHPASPSSPSRPR